MQTFLKYVLCFLNDKSWQILNIVFLFDLQAGDVDNLDRTAGAIRGRCTRVCNVVTAEMDNYEPGVNFVNFFMQKCFAQLFSNYSLAL